MNRSFSQYSSRIKRLNIPIPDYTIFHKSSTHEKVDPKFIGREKSSNKLKAWIRKEKTKCGTYLITGFRGMGKSSFVGKNLNELCANTSLTQHYICNILFFIIFFSAVLLPYSVHSLCFKCLCCCSIYFYAICYLAIISLICLYVFSIKHKGYIQYKYRGFLFYLKCLFDVIVNYKGNFKEKLSIINKLKKEHKDDWRKINDELYHVNTKHRSYRRLPITINLGKEVLNEKDILCIITHELRNKFSTFTESAIANYNSFLRSLIVTLVFACIVIAIDRYNIYHEFVDYTPENYQHYFISLIKYKQETMFFIMLLVASLSIMKAMHIRIIRKIGTLFERINATITFDSSIGKQFEHTRPSGFNFSFRKRKEYPIAQVREIEQDLIDIFDEISKQFGAPEFIFVFDELDKVCSNEDSSDTQKPFTTEYSNEKHFPGEGTSSNRRRNVLHLLANMKLFISTAKAKFIFIAGRELYDAYLADLSDREFSISSIFNGVIYVESFCTNERREKDIMSNAEIYLCTQLIPRSFMKKEIRKTLIESKINKHNFNKPDVGLKLYYKYLILTYKHILKKNKEEEIDERIRLCIDKTIIVLYHFTVYLYHISNGSPKKMSLYFDKYVKECKQEEYKLKSAQQALNILNEDDINVRIDCDSKFCLSFKYMDQRFIGLIHYISFPVTQIIINANQFSDKLLVSASFLVDHIYKFHNTGFSWRNLEHTPELLEVYRIPEFRDFINSIISYLTQTHIIPISCGLYQYKFRKQISEEISLASKFSEEVSALFNFSLDESQTLKQHYLKLEEEYTKRLRNAEYDSPHVKAGIHNILADLYMSDEEFTKAIFEFQTAIRIMQSQNVKHDDAHMASHILFLIRSMLKMGLAFEKRKTYESAYTTYNELIGHLVEYRDIDIEKLNLNYFTTDNDEWPPHKSVLYMSEDKEKNYKEKKSLYPIIKENKEKLPGEYKYCINNSEFVTYLAHHLNKEKNSIIQRITTLEDIRLVYQALLAKLFVIEKMELDGITRENLEIIESEYLYLNFVTNEKYRFIISTDFFKRIGDIMYYKNGIAAEDRDSFFDSLYFWTYDIRKKVQDFCSMKNRDNYKDSIIKSINKVKNADIDNCYCIKEIIDSIQFENNIEKEFIKQLKEKIETDLGNIRLNVGEIKRCNRHRSDMAKKGCNLPCYACKYYNRSMRILVRNLYNTEIEYQPGISRSIKMLSIILQNDTARTERQNHMIQLAEVFDNMGNVLLSCSTEPKNDAKINKHFLESILTDIDYINLKEHINSEEELQLFHVYSSNKNRLSRIEKSILYYWEASICFNKSSEHKKAATCLKKIVKTIQNYLKLSIHYNETSGQELISNNLERIKTVIIKRAILYLYSHYNYINLTEIQKIKWIFSAQMYELISLHQLTLFPDIEEIMLVYYDIMRMCIIDTTKVEETKKEYTKIQNNKYHNKLGKMYSSMKLGVLRTESTIYERILSLRFKATVNQDIITHLFNRYRINKDKIYYENDVRESVRFIDEYLKDPFRFEDILGEYFSYFKNIEYNKENDSDEVCIRLALIEFLITDSMYCLTRILEIISPYTDTTLFTNSYIAEISQLLLEWNRLFDALYMTYRAYASSTNNHIQENITYQKITEDYNIITEHVKMSIELLNNLELYSKSKNSNISSILFNELLTKIGKSNIHYTLNNFSAEKSIKMYRTAKEMHNEGKAYKERIKTMYYLDDDLKNDTIQFDIALERFKINNGIIDHNIENILRNFNKTRIYDVENYNIDYDIEQSTNNRFKKGYTEDYTKQLYN